MIKLIREPKCLPPPYEHCCFCDRPTPFWCDEPNVAICTPCGKKHNIEDVPTKKEWIDKQEYYEKDNSGIEEDSQSVA